MKPIPDQLCELADKCSDQVIKEHLYMLAIQLDDEEHKVWHEAREHASKAFSAFNEFCNSQIEAESHRADKHITRTSRRLARTLTASHLWTGSYAEARELIEKA